MTRPFHLTGGLTAWDRQSRQVQEDYQYSLALLNSARREHQTIREAADNADGLTYDTVMRYIRSGTTKDARGRTVPTSADRLFRPMEILDAQGKRRMRAVYGSKAASDIGGHQAAIGRFLETGDPAYLAPFDGMRRGGVELGADPSLIEAVARAGMLDDLDPYGRGR